MVHSPNGLTPIDIMKLHAYAFTIIILVTAFCVLMMSIQGEFDFQKIYSLVSLACATWVVIGVSYLFTLWR